MYTSIRETGRRKWLKAEGPYLIAALLIAELFYKFHSFVLECVAFLATWLVLSWLARIVSDAFFGGVRRGG